jgi:hypothetical protein
MKGLMLAYVLLLCSVITAHQAVLQQSPANAVPKHQHDTLAAKAVAGGLRDVAGFADSAAPGIAFAQKIGSAAQDAVKSAVYHPGAPTAPTEESERAPVVPPKTVKRLSATLWRTVGLLALLFRVLIGKPVLKVLNILHVLFRPGTVMLQLVWRIFVGIPYKVLQRFSQTFYLFWLFLGSAAILGFIIGVGLAGFSRVLRLLLPSKKYRRKAKPQKRQQDDAVLDRVTRRRLEEESLHRAKTGGSPGYSSLESTPATTPRFDSAYSSGGYFSAGAAGSSASYKRSPPSLSAILSSSISQTPTIREETEEGSTESVDGFASISESEEESLSSRRMSGKKRS